MSESEQKYMSDCPRCGAKRLYDHACPSCGLWPHTPMHEAVVLGLDDENGDSPGNDRSASADVTPGGEIQLAEFRGG